MSDIDAHRVVLVTGANRGIGACVARTLAARTGVRVVCAARTADKADAAVEAVKAHQVQAASASKASNAERGAPSSPSSILTPGAHEPSDGSGAYLAARGEGLLPPIPLVLDVGDKWAISSAPARLRDAGVVRLAALVNNAGVFEKGWSEAAFAANKAVNYTGPVALARTLSDFLQPSGRVIMVSSSYGKLGYLGDSPYAARVSSATSLADLDAISFDANDAFMSTPQPADRNHVPAYKLSKAMLNKATQILHGAHGMRVAAADPGWVKTDMGGPEAAREVEEGARSVLWLVDADPFPSGGFFCDGVPSPW